MVSRRACIIFSAACLLAALASVTAAELFVRDPNPLINVRWKRSLDAAERTTLERRFGPYRLDTIGPTVWRYELTERSRENVGGVGSAARPVNSITQAIMAEFH